MPKLSSTTTNKKFFTTAALLIVVALSTIQAAFAQDAPPRVAVDWKKLGLNAQQTTQIHALEQDWNNKYLRMQPQILDNQKRLVKLLSDPKSDPLEVMSTQQTIARLKEQLRNEATTNYLRKRALLTEAQQHQLESMLHQLVAEKQRSLSPSAASEEQGGFMELIHKVRWAIDQH